MFIRRFGIPLAWLFAAGLHAIAGVWTHLYGGGGLVASPDVIDITLFGALSLVECLILWAVLRPQSFSRSWGRALLATLLCFPWTFTWNLFLGDMGCLFMAHAVWLSLATLVAVGLFLGSIGRAK